jgi:hypothetical protein
MVATFKHFNDILHEPKSELKHLLAKLSHLQGINQSLKAILKQNCATENLALHCAVSTIEEGILILHADTGNWASNLRFHSSALLQQLRRQAEYAGLKSIKIIVKPEPFLSQKKPAQKPTLAPQDVTLIQQLADSIKDPDLKKSLEKLAKNIIVS